MRVQSLIGRDAGQVINVPYHVARALIAVGHAADLREGVMDSGKMKVRHHVGPNAGTTEELPKHAAEALIATGQAALVTDDPAEKPVMDSATNETDKARLAEARGDDAKPPDGDASDASAPADADEETPAEEEAADGKTAGRAAHAPKKGRKKGH